ncbi:alpha amylase [Halothermothrix orenii H 168]|uniref:Alpha-amylase n=2 Tax=Halothermothrix orenii TaxID=31909 RepID=B8D133_HALOH|nr:alpha amylase [Halothermothrix orenii H 168]
MQAFYWDCESNWYRKVKEKLPELYYAGITDIWLPPPSRGLNQGGMGYDIYDHYNLNTRFGTKRELKDLIRTAHRYGIRVIADVVMGHAIGGKKEYNPYLETETYTKFNQPEFPKNYKHFCHNCVGCHTDNSYGEKICYYSDNGYMKDNLIKWCRWLKDSIGFDGFRLDNCKQIRWDFIRDWKEALQTFTIGEYWDGDRGLLQRWRDYTNCNVFNFPLFYSLKEMCNNPALFDMRCLMDNVFEGSVSFVENHDTDRFDPVIFNKILAYAFNILFTDYTCIFWKDYYIYNLKREIDSLLEIRNRTVDRVEIEYADYDLLVARRGNYRIFINKGETTRIYNGMRIDGANYKIAYNTRAEHYLEESMT